MTVTKSGFQVCLQKRTPKVKGINYMIHRQLLASKPLPAPMEVLDQTIQFVNTHLTTFQQLCIIMDAAHICLISNSRNMLKYNCILFVFNIIRCSETCTVKCS